MKESDKSETRRAITLKKLLKSVKFLGEPAVKAKRRVWVLADAKHRHSMKSDASKRTYRDLWS